VEEDAEKEEEEEEEEEEEFRNLGIKLQKSEKTVGEEGPTHWTPNGFSARTREQRMSN
jgi:hypothetical protein